MVIEKNTIPITNKYLIRYLELHHYEYKNKL